MMKKHYTEVKEEPTATAGAKGCGEATFDDGREKVPVREGDVIFVKAGEEHSFVNHARQPMRFICVIPL